MITLRRAGLSLTLVGLAVPSLMLFSGCGGLKKLAMSRPPVGKKGTAAPSTKAGGSPATISEEEKRRELEDTINARIWEVRAAVSEGQAALTLGRFPEAERAFGDVTRIAGDLHSLIVKNDSDSERTTQAYVAKSLGDLAAGVTQSCGLRDKENALRGAARLAGKITEFETLRLQRQRGASAVAGAPASGTGQPSSQVPATDQPRRPSRTQPSASADERTAASATKQSVPNASGATVTVRPRKPAQPGTP